MEGNNKPPFFIGQEVVRIKKGEICGEVGDEHVVDDIDRCPKCKKWFIDIGLRDKPKGNVFISVCFCGNKTVMATPTIWNYATSFVPKKRGHIFEICKEVLDSLPKITEERADPLVLKPKPATVTNLHQQLIDSIDDMIELLPLLPEDEQEEYAEKIRGMIEKANGLVQC